MTRFPFSFAQSCEKNPQKQTPRDAPGTTPIPSLYYDQKKVQKAKKVFRSDDLDCTEAPLSSLEKLCSRTQNRFYTTVSTNQD